MHHYKGERDTRYRAHQQQPQRIERRRHHHIRSLRRRRLLRPRKLSRKGKQCGREKQMPTTDGPTQKQLLLLTLKGPKANQGSWAGLTVKLGENEFTVV